MYQPAASQTYLKHKVLTATPEQLQLMLYEGAIRFALLARQEMLARNFEAAQNAFERADAILCELHNGLRPEVDADLCGKYAALYNFCIRRLHEANLHHQPEPLDDAVQILQHLRETWAMVIESIAHERAEQAQQDSPAHQPVAVGRPGALLAVHS